MQLERDDTGIDLVLKSNFIGIATFAYEPEVQGKLIAGLHHLLDISLACSAIDRGGRCADIVSFRHSERIEQLTSDPCHLQIV